MSDKVNLLLKVFLLSAIIALMIKYLGPFLAIPATPTNVLIGVFSPTIGTIAALVWRSVQSSSSKP